jgi:hypothetical protein
MLLQPDRPGPALLDGGWWPRTDDPAAELPGLILALDKRHGRITRIMLGTAGWDGSRPHRLRVDGPAGARFVRLGWFDSMPGGLLTAISAGGQRTDLVTVPARTGQREALAAMEQAARAGNREHAPAILAAVRELGNLVTTTSMALDGSSPSRCLGHRRLRRVASARDDADRTDDQAPTGSAQLSVDGNGGRP